MSFRTFLPFKAIFTAVAVAVKAATQQQTLRVVMVVRDGAARVAAVAAVRPEPTEATEATEATVLSFFVGSSNERPMGTCERDDACRR